VSTKADLRALRKRLGLKQAQLAAVLGCSVKHISEQERGVAPVRRERLLAMGALIMATEGSLSQPSDILEMISSAREHGSQNDGME
jgi:transcriptional regulator with XRE-family HTH domain